MESITLLANTAASILFNKMLEESGQTLGQEISQKIIQLTTKIREKFTSSGIEGFFKRVQNQPTERNITKFNEELIEQMNEDEDFTKEVEVIIKQIEALGVTRQMIGVNIKAEEIEIEGVDQKTSREGSIEQTIGKDIEATKKVVFRNLKQEN